MRQLFKHKANPNKSQHTLLSPIPPPTTTYHFTYAELLDFSGQVKTMQKWFSLETIKHNSLIRVDLILMTFSDDEASRNESVQVVKLSNGSQRGHCQPVFHKLTLKCVWRASCEPFDEMTQLNGNSTTKNLSRSWALELFVCKLKKCSVIFF